MWLHQKYISQRNIRCFVLTYLMYWINYTRVIYFSSLNTNNGWLGLHCDLRSVVGSTCNGSLHIDAMELLFESKDDKKNTVQKQALLSNNYYFKRRQLKLQIDLFERFSQKKHYINKVWSLLWSLYILTDTVI